MPSDHVRAVHTYIKETCKELDTKYDREALRLICGSGVFAVDNPAEFDQAIARLRDEPDTVMDQIVATQDTTVTAASVDARRKALLKLEGLESDRLESSVEAAYLLGLAVGRRLGPGALRVAGGGAR